MSARQVFLVLAGAILSAAFATAQIPYVSSVVNAASYVSHDRSQWGIAPGSLFVATGDNLGPAELQVYQGYPLQTSLGGTSITVNAGGSDYHCLLIYASAGQVAALLPSTTPLGDVFFTLTYNGEASFPTLIRVVPASFGIFSRNQAGFGPGIVQNVVSSSDRPLNGFATPAHAGQWITIWGTGLGPAPGNEVQGPIPGDLPYAVEVTLGGRPANVIYRGRSGCCPGVDEVYVEVPQGIEGCRVPLVVKAADTLSNFVTLAVANEGQTCPGAELPEELVDSVGRGEEAALGRIELARMALQIDMPGVTLQAKSDVGHAHFARYTANELLSMQSPTSYWLAGISTPGHCTMLPPDFAEDLPLPAVRDGVLHQATAVRRLDAGSQLSVSGHSRQRAISRHGNWYEASLGGLDMENGLNTPEFLEPGDYTITNGGGGKGVGALSVALTVPAPVVWTNRENIRAIPRNQDLTITWNSADPERQIVAVYALAQGDSPENAAAAMCTAEAAAGSITVPAWILSELPASYIYDYIPYGMIGVLTASRPEAEVEFSAPGLHHARAGYVLGDFKYIAFQ